MVAGDRLGQTGRHFIPEKGLSQFREELSARGYSLSNLIGAGGMGAVFHGHHQHLNREVAVKVLSRSLVVDQRAHRRFLNEMGMMAKLNHHAVVDVYDGGVTNDGLPYFVMEYVKGPTLAQVMGRGPSTLSPVQVAQILSPVGSALDYLHNLRARTRDSALPERIIHRDVKPANIIMSPSGAKLTDFGISYVNDETRMTLEGNFVGTVAYTAPELFKGTRDPKASLPGPASDLYSLALIAFELLSGFRLCETMGEFAWRGDRPLEALDGVPASAVLRKALSNDPRNRYSSAADFLRALSEAPAELRNSKRGPLERRVQLKRRVTTVAVCIVALSVIGWGMHLSASWPDGEQRIADAFPQLISRHEGGKGWKGTSCESGDLSVGQQAVIHCSGPEVSYSLADYGTGKMRDLYPVSGKETMRSDRCIVDHFHVSETPSTWAIFPTEPNDRFLVLITGSEADMARFSVPVC